MPMPITKNEIEATARRKSAGFEYQDYPIDPKKQAYYDQMRAAMGGSASPETGMTYQENGIPMPNPMEQGQTVTIPSELFRSLIQLLMERKRGGNGRSTATIAANNRER